MIHQSHSNVLALLRVTIFTLVASVIVPSSAISAEKKPLKVFILAGQSNMQGHAHVRTIDAMRLSKETAPILKEIRTADSSNLVCDRVWISSIGSSPEEKIGKLSVGYGAEPRGPKIGPEYTFGVYMQKLLPGEPILIIKTAWGGKSINTDFRPPSAGAYEFNEAQLEQFKKQNKDVEKIQADRAKASGVYYRLMLDHVKKVLGDVKRVYPNYDEKQGYKLAGFVWFQGWNDMVDRGTYPNRDQPGGYDEYSKVLTHFIRDVRKDLNSPELPFVIGVMGTGGPTSKYGPKKQRYKNVHQNFRDAMAAPAKMPEFKGTVVNVLTEDSWDMELVALQEKEEAIKPKLAEIQQAVKAKTMTREAGQKASDKLYAAAFNEKELDLLKGSVSNAEFHYLGSARIMTRIGKDFAEAMAKLVKD